MVAPAIGAALISGAGSLLGGILGSRGQRKANENNLRIAREQMAFQERMSSTAYQRSTKDLEKAGLNRILAIGGPSSSPGGASAVMQNAAAPIAEGVKGATSSAIAAATQIQQLKNLKVTESAIRAQVEKTLAETALTSSKDVLTQVPKLASETIMEAAEPLVKPAVTKLGQVGSSVGIKAAKMMGQLKSDPKANARAKTEQNVWRAIGKMQSARRKSGESKAQHKQRIDRLFKTLMGN